MERNDLAALVAGTGFAVPAYGPGPSSPVEAAERHEMWVTHGPAVHAQRLGIGGGDWWGCEPCQLEYEPTSKLTNCPACGTPLVQGLGQRR